VNVEVFAAIVSARLAEGAVILDHATPSDPDAAMLYGDPVVPEPVMVMLDPAVIVPAILTAWIAPLQPKPTLNVKVSAFEAPEHEGIDRAVGDPLIEFALPMTVLAACEGNPVSATNAVAVIAPEPVGASDAPVPTSIAAVVFVAEVIDEKAKLPPPVALSTVPAMLRPLPRVISV
jgi:hypothetical protein